jgi:hypothetical protein
MFPFSISLHGQVKLIPQVISTLLLQVREEAGTPQPGLELTIGSSIGVNGYIHDVIYSSTAGEGTEYNPNPSGVFNGVCTVTTFSESNLLCHYELVLYNNAILVHHQKDDSPAYGLGAVIAHGPVTGGSDVAVVTGAEFDLEMYSRGSLAIEQDPTLPVLYAVLTLFE